jgi:hypothetical protein
MAPKYVMRRQCALLIILVIVAIIVSTIMAMTYDKPDIATYEPYVVSQGDTLWDIAKTSNGYGNMDTRDIVDDIRSASNCTANIKEGDRLYIPVYEED